MPIFGSGKADNDVVRYWKGPPRWARVELNELLEGCRATGRVDEQCLDDCVNLVNYLRDTVARDPDEFVRTRQLWRQTLEPRSFPVYRTVGDPFVAFTIYRDSRGETVVTAMHFGRSHKGFSLDTLWMRVVQPRLRLLATDDLRYVERGRQ